VACGARGCGLACSDLQRRGLNACDQASESCQGCKSCQLSGSSLVLTGPHGSSSVPYPTIPRTRASIQKSTTKGKGIESRSRAVKPLSISPRPSLRGGGAVVARRRPGGGQEEARRRPGGGQEEARRRWLGATPRPPPYTGYALPSKRNVAAARALMPKGRAPSSMRNFG